MNNINIENVRFKLTYDLGELKAFKNYGVYDLVKYIDTLLGRNEELEAEVKNLKEEINNIEQNIKDNFRPIPVAEQVGISDRDFI